MYEVIHNFVDSQDEGHVYLVGDQYPRRGKKATLERATELMSDKNAIGVPLIVEIMARPVETEEEKPKKRK